MWFSFLLQGLDPKYVLNTSSTFSYSKTCRETTIPVLPDNTGPVIDSRGSCVPHSLDSIVLDHKSFMEAGGDLKSAKWVLFSSGLMYIHITLASESPYILLRNSRSPLRYNFIVLILSSVLFSSLQFQCTTLLTSASLASSLGCNNVYHAQWLHRCFFYMMHIAPIHHAATVAPFYRQALMSAHSGREDM